MNKQERWQDGFGILPWSYEPSFFLKLFGSKPFTISSDKILYIKEGIQAELDNSKISAVECVKNSISIKIGDDCITLKAGAKSAEISKLILRLSKESKEYSDLLALDKIVPEIGFAYFLKAFDYRGEAYPRAVNLLLKTSIDNAFSDVHFEPNEEGVKISYRLNGKLRYITGLSKDNYEHFIARAKYLMKCDSQIINKPQEGACNLFNTDIRLSTFPTDLGERASFRIIGTNQFKTLASLGWQEEKIGEWLNIINESSGLYIITGAVGSGKTTAMYATLSELVASARGQIRAVTIEDPVEAFIDGICQSSLDTKTEKSLASAFKHLLRQDPDVIALGEIRDVESIREALQAGLSGHLVFATFHAGSAEEAVDRIKMMAAGNELILSGLKGILHLQLNYDGGKANQIPQIKNMISVRLQKDSKG